MVVIFYSVLYFWKYPFRFHISVFYTFALYGGFLDDMGLSCFQKEFGSLKMLIPGFSVDFGAYIYS